MEANWQRLWLGGLLVLVVVTVGSVGFHLIGQWNGLDWGWWDCIYMTVITVSTVGYGEALPISSVQGARPFTVFLILFGMGMLLYFASAVVEYVTSLRLNERRRRREYERKMKQLRDHIIVCGAGTTGIHVIEELIATHESFIVIEHDEARIKEVSDHIKREYPDRFDKQTLESDEICFLHIQGDATNDEVLERARIDTARGVVSALSSDKDNLFVTLSAHQMNPKLRIVARSREVSATSKMKAAGATSVVSPNFIGGMRMVSEMIRPEVTEFLDLMLRNKDKTLRIEEATILPGSPIEGKRLADANIRRDTELLVIAARRIDGTYKYNPGPDFVLAAGTTLIVLGEIEDVISLRRSIQPA